MQWNQEQETVNQSRNRTLHVSAAAGSRQTDGLVERVVRGWT